MKIESNILISLVISFILIANIAFIAYATTATFNHVTTTVGTVTNDECTAITKTPTLGYVFMSCGTSAGATYNIRVVSGTTQLATTTVAVTAGVEDKQRLFAVDQDTVVFASGTSTSGATLFREYTISGSTVTNTRSFLAPCTLGSQSAFSQIGTSIWFACTDGTVREFGMLTFTQLSSYSTTISATCTTPRGVMMRSATQGVVFCDSTDVVSFTVSGTTISEVNSITVTLDTGNFGSANEGLFAKYNNGYLYITSTHNLNIPRVVALSSTTWQFSGSEIILPTGGGSDMAIASGGYWVITDISNSQVAILDTNTAPPSNLLTSQALGTTIGQDSHISSSDGSNFVISKGVNGNTTIFYFTISNILIDGQPPSDLPPSSTGGIDCDLPENANILICRLGSSGTAGNAGAFVIGNTTSGTGLLGLGCSVGLVDCRTDDNPQTNGLGLLIFVASLFVVVGMFYSGIGARATWQLPVYFWAIIIIALSAFFTITGLINPVFLILSIIAIIALAVPKIQGIFSGRGIDSGGSTL